MISTMTRLRDRSAFDPDRRKPGSGFRSPRQMRKKGRADIMAVTNGEIILRESLELMKQGVLKSTGRVFIQELPDGSKIELPEPEPIHTYNGWKDLGFQVKKGEHAKASFPIWKWKGQKNEETGEEEGGQCYQRKAFWFTFDQVEKVG